MSLISETVGTVCTSQNLSATNVVAEDTQVVSFVYENAGTVTADNAIVDNITLGIQGSIDYQNQAVRIQNDALPGNVLVGSAFSTTITGTQNLLVGTGPASFLTTGSSNVVMGTSAGQQLTTQNNNIAIGTLAMNGTILGDDNISIGLQGNKVSINSNNISLGGNTLNEAVSNNIAIGPSAGAGSCGSNNIFMGFSAGGNSTMSDNNICIGTETIFTAPGVSNSINIGFSSEWNASNTIVFARNTTGLDENDRLILGYTNGGGAVSSIVPAGTDDTVAGVPLGGLYSFTNANQSKLCIKLA